GQERGLGRRDHWRWDRSALRRAADLRRAERWWRRRHRTGEPRSPPPPRTRAGYPRADSRRTASAPHRGAALAATAANTGRISAGELAMTRRISPVAVCWSRASVSAPLRLSTSVFKCASEPVVGAGRLT